MSMTDKQLRNTIAELERQNATLLAANRELVSKEQQIKDAFAENNKAKTLLTNVLDSISDGFVAFDKQWTITYVNSKGSFLLDGRLPEQLIGKHALTAFPTDLNPAFLSQKGFGMGKRKPN